MSDPACQQQPTVWRGAALLAGGPSSGAGGARRSASDHVGGPHDRRSRPGGVAVALEVRLDHAIARRLVTPDEMLRVVQARSARSKPSLMRAEDVLAGYLPDDGAAGSPRGCPGSRAPAGGPAGTGIAQVRPAGSRQPRRSSEIGLAAAPTDSRVRRSPPPARSHPHCPCGRAARDAAAAADEGWQTVHMDGNSSWNTPSNVRGSCGQSTNSDWSARSGTWMRPTTFRPGRDSHNRTTGAACLGPGKSRCTSPTEASGPTRRITTAFPAGPDGTVRYRLVGTRGRPVPWLA